MLMLPEEVYPEIAWITYHNFPHLMSQSCKVGPQF